MENYKIINALDFALAQMHDWLFRDAARGIKNLRDELGNAATEAGHDAGQPQHGGFAMLLNHGDIIKQEDEFYNGHGWEIVPSSWVGTAVDFESPPNRHCVFIRRKTSESESMQS